MLSAAATTAANIIKMIASLLLGAGLLVGALALLLRIPEVARAIDALLVPSSGPEAMPGTHEPDDESMSAADIRSQTEILRALKEQLDAELQAARDTIRRERVQDDQQARKENA